MDRFWKYAITGAGFWLAVDYTTAFNPDFSRWLSYMPTIWLFYLGFPLLFAYLIYRRRWSDRRLLLPMIGALLVVEIAFSGNALLFTFPIMLVMIPVALMLYALVTYVPRWITDGTLKGRVVPVAGMLIVWLVIAILSYVTRARGG